MRSVFSYGHLYQCFLFARDGLTLHLKTCSLVGSYTLPVKLACSCHIDRSFYIKILV